MNYFKEIVDLQDGFNSKLDPNWRENKWDNALATVLEGAEAIDQSFPSWKWWKKGLEDNPDNYEVESIDKLHFITALGLQKFSNQYLANKFQRIYDDCIDDYINAFEEESVDPIRAAKGVMFETLKYDLQDGSEEQFDNIIYTLFVMIFGYTEISEDKDLYSKYLVKNILNQFRKNNGYKEGTYIKHWNGLEDNVVAFNIMKEWPTCSSEELYSELTNKYSLVK